MTKYFYTTLKYAQNGKYVFFLKKILNAHFITQKKIFKKKKDFTKYDANAILQTNTKRKKIFTIIPQKMQFRAQINLQI